MKRPIFVRTLTEDETAVVRAGLRSSDPFVMRRAQVLLASARGEPVPTIARLLSCNEQTVRNAIHAFATHGLAALTPRSRVAHTRPHTAFVGPQAEALRDLLHRSPREFGHPTSVWTLELAAAVSYAEGLTRMRLSAETIRATLARLGVRWQCAKQWITSPDPAYLRKKPRTAKLA